MSKEDLELFKTILIDLIKLIINKNKEIREKKDK
jgi:hypothetical protein